MSELNRENEATCFNWITIVSRHFHVHTSKFGAFIATKAFSFEKRRNYSRQIGLVSYSSSSFTTSPHEEDEPERGTRLFITRAEVWNTSTKSDWWLKIRFRHSTELQFPTWFYYAASSFYLCLSLIYFAGLLLLGGLVESKRGRELRNSQPSWKSNQSNNIYKVHWCSLQLASSPFSLATTSSTFIGLRLVVRWTLQ